jgi:hypothetical protein
VDGKARPLVALGGDLLALGGHAADAVLGREERHQLQPRRRGQDVDGRPPVAPDARVVGDQPHALPRQHRRHLVREHVHPRPHLLRTHRHRRRAGCRCERKERERHLHGESGEAGKTDSVFWTPRLQAVHPAERCDGKQKEGPHIKFEKHLSF